MRNIWGRLAVAPWSAAATYRREAASLRRPSEQVSAHVDEADLASLPVPVARYLRRAGAVGRPHVAGFEMRLHGRIRADAHSPWMPFAAWQTNVYGPRTERLFFMDARMRGLPVTVFHRLREGRATMRGRLLGLIPVVNAAGPDMDRSETVTLFNDLCVCAPAALVDAPVEWDRPGASSVRGHYTNAGITVSADLRFDASGDLVDFVSEDRAAQVKGGTAFVRMPWSTPVRGYREWHGRRSASAGEGRWHADTGEFAYLELEVLDLRAL